MSKQEFLAQLRKALSGLPQDDIEERLTFYSEMIEDRVEEGLSENEAVFAIGSVDEIVAQVVADIPLAKIANKRIRTKGKLSTGEITLLALGSPKWLSLIIAAFAVIFSLYISLWTIIISLWAVFASLAACSIGSVLACIIFAVGGNCAPGLALLAAGMVCAGLAVFMFYGCRMATKGTLVLSKKTLIWTKKCFIKKEVE